MSIPQPFRRGLIACVLLSAALSSAALTFGRSRGVALVGRPLDVMVPLTLDTPGQAGELCPEADVFHGDTRVDASRVTARVEPGNGQTAVVRILSSLPVDEPVVTVYLRLGCRDRFTRRFVLLTEEPGEIAPFASSQPAVPVPVPGLAPARPGTAVPSTAGQGSAGVTPVRPAPARAERARRPAATDAPMTPRGGAAGRMESALPSAPQRTQPVTRGPARSAARPGSSRSRLTVDLLDLAPERDPQLRASTGLTGAPSTDEAVRAQAAALWRSINAQPEDVLRDLQRVQALENDVKGLRGLVATNDRTLTELRGQLDQARGERTLTLAAIALLALLLAAVVVSWFLRRGERGGSLEWWRRAAPAADPPRAGEMDLRVDESMFDSLKKPPRLPVLPSAAAHARTQAIQPQPAPAAVAAAGPANAVAAPDRNSGPLSSFHSGFQSSSMASMRMVKAEELVDIQQQADFFMSLGQTEQAIEVLESHIQNHSETSALVWLDLLAIYRALKRRDDYELLRGDFQRVFNAEVPAYDASPTVSGGLEDYPRALTRIAALWPSPKVMDVIEESIFRKPGVDGAEPFDLEAYRELVMLYNLGREVVKTEPHEAADGAPAAAAGPGFNETSMQPLSVDRRGSAAPGLDYGAADTDSGAPDTDSTMESAPASMIDSSSGQTGMGDIVDFESMLTEESLSPLSISPRTIAMLDPQVPRPSPRLGLDIDLTAPAEPQRKTPSATGSIDFELSEPDLDTDSRQDKPQ